MGLVTIVSDSRHFGGMNPLRLTRWSTNQGSESLFGSLCPCKLHPHVSRSFRYSRAPDRSRWLHSSHKMDVTSYVVRNSVVSQKLGDESSAEVMATRAVKIYKSLTVFAAVLSTVLGGTPALAGVEFMLQPKSVGMVDASTNKVSSVETILAKQLARRFREMSDEELILVLQELLKASKSSVSPEDLVLDGKGRQGVPLEGASKEGSKVLVDDGPFAKDSVPQADGARNEGPELSPSSSKLGDSVTEKIKEDSYKPVDSIDRPSELKGGGAKSGFQKLSIPGWKPVEEVLKQEKSVVPDQGREPNVSRDSDSEGAITTKNSRSPVNVKGRDEAEQSLERSGSVGEIESQDLTGILWDEWKRRLEGQSILEPSNNGESSMLSSATDVWQKLQISFMSALKGASKFSGWVSDNREALDGGVLASGSIFFVLFIRQKFLAFSAGKGIQNERDLTVDRTATRGSDLPDLKIPGEDPRGFLQSVSTSFKAAQTRGFGSEEVSAQVEKAFSSATSNSSGETTTAGPDNVPSNVESSPATKPSEDDMRPKRQETKEKSALQDLNSYAARFLRPSVQFPDRFVRSTNDRQRDGGNNRPESRLKRGSEIGNTVYGTGLDDSGNLVSSDLQGQKNVKEGDVVYTNPQFPPSTSTTVDGSSKSLESPAQIDDLPLTGTRGSPLTSNMEREGVSASKSSRGIGQGTTVNKKTGTESREKVEVASSERRRDIANINSFPSNFLQKDPAYQPRHSNLKGYSVPGSTDKPSFGTSSRPNQPDPPAYRQNTADKERDRSELQDRSASAFTYQDEMEGAGNRTSLSRSTSFLSGKSDLSDGEKGRLPPVQITQGEGVTSDEFVGSQSTETFSPTSGASDRFEDGGLGTEHQKTFTEEILPTDAGKQDRVHYKAFMNNTSALVRDPGQFSVLNEVEYAESATENEGDNVGGASKFMDSQTKVIHLQKDNGESSGTDTRFSTAEQDRDRDNMSKIDSIRGSDISLGILTKSTRKSSEISERDLQVGKVTDATVPYERDAAHLPGKAIHDEGMVRSGTFRKRWLASEVKKDEDLEWSSASNSDAAGTGTDMRKDDVWAGGAVNAFGAKGFKHSYNATENKPEDMGTRSGGGRELESKRAGQSRPELDSFFHNQNFWVRDADGVFIKHARESRGMIRQGSESNMVRGDVRGLKNDAVDASVAPRRAVSRVNRDAYPAGKTRLHKQRRSLSSRFEYRQLYLTSTDDSKTPGDRYESPGNKKYMTLPSLSDTAKTKHTRYGVEKTR